MNCFAVCQGAFSRQLYFHLSFFATSKFAHQSSQYQLHFWPGYGEVLFMAYTSESHKSEDKVQFGICDYLKQGHRRTGFFSKRFFKI